MLTGFNLKQKRKKEKVMGVFLLGTWTEFKSTAQTVSRPRWSLTKPRHWLVPPFSTGDDASMGLFCPWLIRKTEESQSGQCLTVLVKPDKGPVLSIQVTPTSTSQKHQHVLAITQPHNSLSLFSGTAGLRKGNPGGQAQLQMQKQLKADNLANPSRNSSNQPKKILSGHLFS